MTTMMYYGGTKENVYSDARTSFSNVAADLLSARYLSSEALEPPIIDGNHKKRATMYLHAVFIMSNLHLDGVMLP